MRRWAFATILGCVGLGSATASAYTFDDQCAPLTEHTPGFDNPNVMLVVDRSGSMLEEMTPGWTRWDTATQVLREVTTDLERPGPCNSPSDTTCDPVRFGLGFFSSQGILSVEPGEDTASEIRDTLDDTNPSGQTQTHTGINVFANSARLGDPDRPQVAVLVTDGAPDNAQTARASVRQICNIRERNTAPVTTYVVGFGPGSNQAVNGFMAAAGGTGTCCKGADWPCDETFQADPCQMSEQDLNSAIRDTGADDSTYIHSDYQCGGSLEATDGESFKRGLLSITEEASCTFELDIPEDYPDAAASSDPGATFVEMAHRLFGDVRLPYCAPGDTACGLEQDLIALGVEASAAASFADEGWFFPDTTRRRVRVTDGLCTDIQAKTIPTVRTQVACVCRFTGQDCTVTLEGFTNEQLQNMRCAAGVYECVDGVDVCTSQYGPMPEICNGIDDDCDGGADNMSESWKNPSFQTPAYAIPANFVGIDCQQHDVCMCANGPDEISGTDPQSFYASWSGGCLCGEGLDDAEPLYTPAPAKGSEAAQAGCSSTGTGAGGGLLILAIGGLILRRRRRSD